MTEEQIRKELKTDYPLIPMKDIEAEARIIAVQWMDCGDRGWIGEKHKLASDIMNYARRQSSPLQVRIKELEQEVSRYKRLLELAKQFWDKAEQSARKNYVAAQSLESELDMNEILTKENEQLREENERLRQLLNDHFEDNNYI